MHLAAGGVPGAEVAGQHADQRQDADDHGAGTDMRADHGPEQAGEQWRGAHGGGDLEEDLADVGGVAMADRPACRPASGDRLGVGGELADGFVAVLGQVEDDGSTAQGQHQRAVPGQSSAGQQAGPATAVEPVDVVDDREGVQLGGGLPGGGHRIAWGRS